MKKLHSITWPCLCILFLLLTGCAQAQATVQQAGAASHGAAQQAPKQLTYVAIGASDTFGIGTDDPYTENWPTDLANLLGSNVHLINLGIPEIRIHEALRLELPVALDSHPDLRTIWLAVNDLANHVPLDSYAHDLDLMLSRLQAAAPHARIAVANVPDLTLLPYFASFERQALRQLIQNYNTAIADIVNRHHVILVDLSQQGYNLKAHPEYISSDGLHPNDLGYQQLAKLFYQALQAAIKSTGRS